MLGSTPLSPKANPNIKCLNPKLCTCPALGLDRHCSQPVPQPHLRAASAHRQHAARTSRHVTQPAQSVAGGGCDGGAPGCLCRVSHQMFASTSLAQQVHILDFVPFTRMPHVSQKCCAAPILDQNRSELVANSKEIIENGVYFSSKVWSNFPFFESNCKVCSKPPTLID